MASLYTRRSKSIFRTFTFISLYSFVIIGVFWYISLILESPIILYFAVFFIIAINLFAYFKGSNLVIKLTNAKKASRNEHFDFYTIAENLSITAGMQTPALYVIEDDAINAFATGRNEKNSLIAITSGAINKLEKQELEGVIAHELAHIKNRDILLTTILVISSGVVTILLDYLLHLSFLRDSEKGALVYFLIILVSYITIPIFLFIIRMAVSRNREYLADETGSLITRNPEALARALKKIRDNPTDMKNKSNATAHLFLQDPYFKKISKKRNSISKKFSSLFSTHPPIDKRIKALEESIKV